MTEIAKLLAEVESLKSKIIAIEEMTPRTGNYKQLQESIATAITAALATSRFQDAIMERLRALTMGRDDMSAYIQRAAQTKTTEYLTSPSGQAFVAEIMLQHSSIKTIIDQNVTGALSKREFINALSTAFRQAIVAEPLALGALVDALAADEKGSLAKSLMGNQAFMDRHTQAILTKMRDSLA